MTVSNTTTANPVPPGVTAPRRILEKPIAIAIPPPTQSPQQQQQQPVKRDIQSAVVASNLMLSPAPQPHAGCYAVPVPVTAAGSASSKSFLPSGTVTTAAVITTQETVVAPTISTTKVSHVGISSALKSMHPISTP